MMTTVIVQAEVHKEKCDEPASLVHEESIDEVDIAEVYGKNNRNKRKAEMPATSTPAKRGTESFRTPQGSPLAMINNMDIIEVTHDSVAENIAPPPRNAGKNNQNENLNTIVATNVNDNTLSNTVFLKGCHDNLAAIVYRRWGDFEREFQSRFGKAVSFKISGPSIRVVCTSLQQKDRLMQCHDLLTIPINVSEPFSVVRRRQAVARNRNGKNGVDNNRSPEFKYVIRGVPAEITDEEVKATVKAVWAKRIYSFKEGNRSPTLTVIFQVEAPFNDKSIIIRGLLLPVSIYIPKPIRCIKCNRFGHTSRFCKYDVRCVRCNKAHDYNDCPVKDQAEYRCGNCHGNHSAAFRQCPKYNEVQQILKISAKNRMSYADATKAYRQQHISLQQDTVNGVIMSDERDIVTSRIVVRPSRRQENGEQITINVSPPQPHRESENLLENDIHATAAQGAHMPRLHHQDKTNKRKNNMDKSELFLDTVLTDYAAMLYAAFVYIQKVAARVGHDPDEIMHMHYISKHLYENSVEVFGEDFTSHFTHFFAGADERRQ